MKVVGKMKTPRNGMEYDRVPSQVQKDGSHKMLYTPEEYGAVLDTVYEIAQAVKDANGVSVHTALQSAVTQTGYRIMAVHHTLIAAHVGA